MNEERIADALLINVHPQLGRIASIFSNAEEFDKYLKLRDSLLGHHSRMTVEELASVLKANGVIDQVVLD